MLDLCDIAFVWHTVVKSTCQTFSHWTLISHKGNVTVSWDKSAMSQISGQRSALMVV